MTTSRRISLKVISPGLVVLKLDAFRVLLPIGPKSPRGPCGSIHNIINTLPTFQKSLEVFVSTTLYPVLR